MAGDDVPNKKPDPSIYRIAAERLKVDPKECFVIEDSTIGLKVTPSRLLLDHISFTLLLDHIGFTLFIPNGNLIFSWMSSEFPDCCRPTLSVIANPPYPAISSPKSGKQKS